MIDKPTKQSIDWNSSRGLAYKTAKEHPGVVQKFQGENGFCTVWYRRPVMATATVGFLSDLAEPDKPGFWYERPVLDLTKIAPDRSDIGFRVYDTECEE